MTTPAPPRFMGGYGPAVVVGVVLLFFAAIVPSVSRDEPIPATELATGGGVEDTLGTTPGSIDAGTTVPTSVAGGPAGGAGANRGRPAAAQGGSAGKPGQVVGCTGEQVKGDPYSPPCYKWGGGDNGGATSHGVTADSINVTIRAGTFDDGVIDAVSQAALKQGAANPLAGETPELIRKTIDGLIEYFNKYYEFYGRKMVLKYVTPKGDPLAEILGGGQEGAEADAITAKNELQSFADISGLSPPYADALARRGVIAMGAPYMSQGWFQSRAPYEWSWFTDCDTVVRTVSSYYVAKLGGKPASYAGGELKGRPRKTAIIAPDSDWFSQCVNASVSTLIDAGLGGEVMNEPFRYKLDLTQMAPQAYALLPRLVSEQVTTVVCACDPLILLFLTSKAKEQGYQPEWMVTGVAFNDQDAVAQIFEQSVWDGAFGVSFASQAITLTGGPGYRAYKSVRPDDVPSRTVEALFLQIQMLAIGIQMAGPGLTPQSFEAGMFKYPPRTGPAGTWDFGPGDYTGPGDAREVFYSPGAPSSATGGKGAYVDPSNGTKRYRAGQFPPGEPAGR